MCFVASRGDVCTVAFGPRVAQPGKRPGFVQPDWTEFCGGDGGAGGFDVTLGLHPGVTIYCRYSGLGSGVNTR